MTMKYDDDVKLRLRRAEGQIRGVLRMMEEEKSCKEVVSQLAAVRSAVDRAIACVVAANLERCILEERDSGGDSGRLVREAVELLIRSR